MHRRGERGGGRKREEKGGLGRKGRRVCTVHRKGERERGIERLYSIM